MEKSLAFLATHLGVGIAENEADGGEEVALARSISADDDIGTGGEGLNDGLVLVAVLMLARTHEIELGGNRVAVRTF